MEYTTFKTMVEQLQEHDKLVDTLYPYIHIEIFDDLQKVINTLLSLVYSESSVDYVFYSWLYENNTLPVEIDGVKYPCETIEQLYGIMERLNEDE